MTRVEMWTPYELEVFLAATANTRLEAAWHLVAFSRMRIHEVLAVRWTDIDAQTGLIAVENAVAGVPYAALAVPQTIECTRQIGLDPALASILARHQGRQEVERSEWGAYYATGDLVVCGENGRPLPARSLESACRQAAKRAGLPPAGLPTLRETGRRAALSRGVAS